MANNQPNKPEQEKKKKSIAFWWRNLGKGGRIAICCLLGAAAITAIAVPTVIAINNQSKSSITVLGANIDKEKSNVALNKDSTITFTYADNKEFVKINYVKVGDKEISSDLYTLVDGNTQSKKVVIKAEAMTSIKVEISVKLKDKQPEPGEKYAITLAASPTTGGAVSGAGEYAKGASATVTATPNGGYSFEGWYENDIKIGDAGASYIFNVTSARSLVAKFTPNISGTITITGNPIVGQTLTANYTGTETITYQWYRGDTAISSATNSTYTLVDDDIDYAIKVKAIGTGEYSGSVESAATEVVTIVYQIDWVTTKFDGTNTLYDLAKTATSIEFLKDGSTDGTLCGETTNDKIYYSFNNNALKVWSKGKIAFSDNDLHYDTDLGTETDIAMFCKCTKVTSIDLSNVDTSNLTKMKYLFYQCFVLKEIKNIYSLNTSNATNMDCMFSSCPKLETIDVSHFNTTKVTSMNALFATTNNNNLTEIRGLSSFNTSNVTGFVSMFQYCNKLKTIDLSSFTISGGLNIAGQMFMDCSSLTTIYCTDNFNLSSKPTLNSNNMFKNCSSLVGGYGTTYDSNKIDKTYAHIDGGSTNKGYFTPTHNLTFNTSNNEYEWAATNLPAYVHQYKFKVNENDPGVNSFSVKLTGTETHATLDSSNYKVYVNGELLTSGVSLIEDGVTIAFPKQNVGDEISIITKPQSHVPNSITARVYKRN